MTKKKEMRIKEVGATINLGNYSTLHVTVGEEAEYSGLELQRATNYLKTLADKMGGILNLPDEVVDKKKIKAAKKLSTPHGQTYYSFEDAIPIVYDHNSHAYTTQDGKPLTSVTQFLSQFYPFTDVVKQEYMDFAASFGNLVHTAIQNAVIGKPPKKDITKQIVTDTLDAMGDYTKAWVEQFLVSVEDGLAGRFDILTRENGECTLWDVKTNSDIFMKLEECRLPEEALQYLSKFWHPATIFGEHCLQLNLYAYIIEKSGITVKDIKIIHIPDEFKEVIPVPKIDTKKFLELVR